MPSIKIRRKGTTFFQIYKKICKNFYVFSNRVEKYGINGMGAMDESDGIRTNER